MVGLRTDFKHYVDINQRLFNIKNQASLPSNSNQKVRLSKIGVLYIQIMTKVIQCHKFEKL